jgi:hypothetical protein
MSATRVPSYPRWAKTSAAARSSRARVSAALTPEMRPISSNLKVNGANRDPWAQGDGAVQVLISPDAALVVVAGANNAGVSAVIETFGPRGGPPAVVKMADPTA